MKNIPTAKMLREGGYEAEHYAFYGLRGPFVPEVENILLGRIVRTFGPGCQGKSDGLRGFKEMG